MATLIDAGRVNYLCSCKRLKPLSSLYFCKYCEWLTLKCKDCVFHEIDQKYFCPNCFDNKVLKEVMALKYKCSNCYSCPSCKNLLMIRASTAKNKELLAAAAAATSQSGPETSKTPTPSARSDSSGESGLPTPATPQQPQLPKVFYLMCGFCRWSTRDAGIPDTLSTPGGWKIPDNPNLKRLKELTEAYQIIAQREKLEKERKRFNTAKSRRFHLTGSTAAGTNTNAISGLGTGSSILSTHPTDKYGILGSIHKRQTAASQTTNKIDLQTPFDQYLRSLVGPGETVDSFEPLSSDVFTKEININSITSIGQRHANPDFQPTRFTELYPLNKYYLSKESKRCTGCEHNVLKPESNITSIKFKLHQMALKMANTIEIDLKANEVILTVTNRCEFDVNISFLPISLETSEGGESGFVIVNSFRSNSTITFGDDEKNPPTIKIDRQDNAKSQAPMLTQADIDTNGMVCFRRDNKIAVSARVRIHDPVARVRCAFEMRFSNANTPAAAVDSPASSSSSTQLSAVTTSTAASSPVTSSAQACVNPQTFKIFLDLGPIGVDKCSPTPKYIEDCLSSAKNVSP